MPNKYVPDSQCENIENACNDIQKGLDNPIGHSYTESEDEFWPWLLVICLAGVAYAMLIYGNIL